MISRVFSILFLFVCSYFFAINSSYASVYLSAQDSYLDTTFKNALDAKNNSQPSFVLNYQKSPIRTISLSQSSDTDNELSSQNAELLEMFGINSSSPHYKSLVKNLNSNNPMGAMKSAVSACMASIDSAMDASVANFSQIRKNNINDIDINNLSPSTKNAINGFKSIYNSQYSNIGNID